MALGLSMVVFYFGNVWRLIMQVNGEKVAVTSKKRSQALYRWHSGRPCEMTEETFDSLQHQIPGWIIELAVRGMLPKGQVGISLSLSYCVRMDMHQQVNRCGSAHVYYLLEDLNLGQATQLLLKTKQMQKRWKGLNSKCLLCHTVTRWLHWKGDPFQMHQTLSLQLYVRHVQVLKLTLMWRFAGVKFLGKLTITRWCLFNTFEGSWSASTHHFVSRLSPHLEWAAQRMEWPPLYPLLWPLIFVPLPVSE
jgi:hypothetical protein